MREWDAQERGRAVREKKLERDTLIERATKGLPRNIALGKKNLYFYLDHFFHLLESCSVSMIL